MLTTVLGSTMIAGAVGYMAWEHRPKQMKIRQSIRSVVVKQGLAHECYVEDRDIKVHPSVEYVIPKEYGYRALIHLPERITEEHFVTRKEVFEHKLGYPISISSQGDIIFMDIFTGIAPIQEYKKEKLDNIVPFPSRYHGINQSIPTIK